MRCSWTRPQLMGVESIELDTVNLRMVARTLPGKQFEVGRRIRVLVVRALRRAGVVVANGRQHTDGRGHRASRRRQAAPRRRRRARRSRRSDVVAEGQAWPDAASRRSC